MGSAAAKKDDQVTSIDMHTVVVPGPSSALLPHPFSANLDGSLVDSVKITGSAAAVEKSTPTNNPGHQPTPPGTAFTTPPDNSGSISGGSPTVRFGGKPAARVSDMVQTCSEGPGPTGSIVANSTVHVA
jgi:uncharacterized Zn-binding protein involved in type VI secretion